MPRDFQWNLPGAHHHLKRKENLFTRIHLDGWLLLALLLLMGVGLLVLYSATGGNLNATLAQGYRFALALVVMLVVAQVPPRYMKRWAPAVFAIALLMLVAVLFMGTDAKGAQRWLVLGPVRFQPSELMKLALPLMLASYLSQRHLPPGWKHLFIATVILVVPVLLIARQPDLGTSVLVAASGLVVLFLAGLSWKLIFFFIGLGMAALPALWMLLHDYQKNRVLTFLNPERDPLGTGWNIIQSKTAIGSGGLEGKGWLQGTQSRLEFLPERHTDFIIAVLAEETGLIGVSLLLALYLFIIWRGMLIATSVEGTFSRLLASSIILTFFVYVFVNIGMVSGLLPVVGVPLPLVSFGGTSSLTLMAGFGILMSIHTHKSLLNK
ncbi:rod shape-determining protein RodA [Marinospirillum alkaliphilum]|uniref:Peptidoglycan glycosyltransferase MrdB n=1 Tax=Marinospirillum alkaliphilum DSM 21637 TaxID=1122209 RepID=A0A1K1YNI4_9GAMM|nr:rod shape-determining protein RodA [Marinospirillum alkaliphilum]SFX62884.1 cell elongation-specific peptidoglycan biosynthesis regulator RodA [Marinospirillum alkaliphilum DSM 21637]